MANEQGTAGLVKCDGCGREGTRRQVHRYMNSDHPDMMFCSKYCRPRKPADALEAATAPAPAPGVESVMALVDDFADAQAELLFWRARDEQEHLATATRDRAAVEAAITDLARERDAAVNAVAAETARADAATARAGMLRDELAFYAEPKRWEVTWHHGSWPAGTVDRGGLCNPPMTHPAAHSDKGEKARAALAADAGDAAPADALGGDGPMPEPTQDMVDEAAAYMATERAIYAAVAGGDGEGGDDA